MAWHRPRRVRFRGKMVTIRDLADAFGVPFNDCLTRYNRGYRDPWQILFGPEGKPVPFTVSKEQKAWLRETAWARSGQEAKVGRRGSIDSEWEIACDLIGVPRVFAEELREVMNEQ